MRFEGVSNWTATDSDRLARIAQAMHHSVDYPAAVRNVMRAAGVTNEGEIKQAMRKYSPHVDIALATIRTEHKAALAVEEEMLAAMRSRAEEIKMAEEERRRREANEHILDPDGEEASFYPDSDLYR